MQEKTDYLEDQLREYLEDELPIDFTARASETPEEKALRLLAGPMKELQERLAAIDAVGETTSSAAPREGE